MDRKNPKPIVNTVSLCGGLISFVTNAAPSLLVFPTTLAKHIKALSSLLNFGAEIEQLSLDNIKDNRSVTALGSALRDSDAIASISIDHIRSQHNLVVCAIAEALKNQKSLRKVSIRGGCEDSGAVANMTCKEMASRIAGAFQPTSRITSLTLYGGMLEVRDAMVSILRGIRNLRSLESLELGQIAIGNLNANELVETLKCLPQLRELSLCRTEISESGGKILGPALSAITALKLVVDNMGVVDVLDGMLSGTAIGTAANLRELTLKIHQFVAAEVLSLAKLVQHAPHLRSLDMSWSRMDNDSGIIFGKALKHCARSLEELNILGCNLGSKAIAAICGSGLLRLRSLHMDYNFSYGIGSQAISELLLAKSGSILRLSMCNVQLLEADARKLGKGLVNNRSLQFLDLSRNVIFDQGAAALLDSIPAAHPLEELDLDSCAIGDSGAAVVGRFILRSCYIKRVSVQYNEIMVAGFRAIAESSGGMLEYLDLSRNPGGDEGAIQIAEKVIRKCKSMQKLRLVDTAMEDRGIAAVVRAIEERNKKNVLRKLVVSVARCLLNKVGSVSGCIVCP